MYWGKRLLVFWAFVYSTLSLALKFEVYGDSISAGFLSGTKVSSTNIAQVTGVMSDFSKFLATGQQEHALISKYERRDLSWSSQLRGILASAGYQIDLPDNTAVTGSWTGGVTFAIQNRPEEKDPAWAFFFVGHNDLCGKAGTAEEFTEYYRDEYDKALSEWNSRHTGSTAYLISVVPVYKLYASLDKYVWARTSTGRELRCNETWNQFIPYCRHYYKKHSTGQLENYLKPRVDGMDAAMRTLANQWTQKGSERKNRFVYVDVKWPDKFQPDWIALDCYHITEVGQRKLAEAFLEEIRP